MISSTFYDLRQVRADLRDFLEKQLGFRVLVSERTNFPVDPDTDTIENCRRRVEQDTDVLVLLIGGRYGSIEQESMKSITNIEYLAARAKGIPVYGFVQSNVLASLPLWKDNPDADFSSIVETSQVFDFIEQVRSEDLVWTFEFTEAQEIIDALRSQFSFLTSHGLSWVRKASQSTSHHILETLVGPPLRTAVEKPTLWEYRLLAESLVQEIEKRKELRLQQRLRLVSGPHEPINIQDFSSWGLLRLSEMQAMTTNFTTITNDFITEALGPDGEEGDLELIVLAARQLGQLYEESLQWSLRVLRVANNKDFTDLVDAMARFTEGIVTEIEGAGPALLTAIRQAQAEKRAGVEGVIRKKVILRPNVPGAADFQKAVDRLMRQLKHES